MSSGWRTQAWRAGGVPSQGASWASYLPSQTAQVGAIPAADGEGQAAWAPAQRQGLGGDGLHQGLGPVACRF
eukprot:scaffold77438_cov44-Prasinocladus_malaysianus.AAC.2